MLKGFEKNKHKTHFNKTLIMYKKDVYLLISYLVIYSCFGYVNVIYDFKQPAEPTTTPTWKKSARNFYDLTSKLMEH